MGTSVPGGIHVYRSSNLERIQQQHLETKTLSGEFLVNGYQKDKKDMILSGYLQLFKVYIIYLFLLSTFAPNNGGL